MSDQDPELESVLATFREEWKNELKISPSKTERSVENDTEDSDEIKARTLYLNGSQKEKAGEMYEAIQFYKRAIQLVPDIDIRLARKPKEFENNNESESKQEVVEESNDDDDDIQDGELLFRLQKKVGTMNAICCPKTSQKGTHISVLPMEMILYILRWVVSSDLDLRSLETFSMVCRGFYLCARDSEIWRLACSRVWGSVSPRPYPSWREMYVERPRVNFNGCYIGKTSYIRYGENSFQDQFYRPWHYVSYCRYLRFFPEGAVLVLTSAEDPSQCVSKMKQRNAPNPVLNGFYKVVDDDRVVLVVVKHQEKQRKGKRKEASGEQRFHIELQIRSSEKKAQKHLQLVWKHYSIFTKNFKGDESTCNFELGNSRYPPFRFSRVKSYAQETDSLLQ